MLFSTLAPDSTQAVFALFLSIKDDTDLLDTGGFFSKILFRAVGNGRIVRIYSSTGRARVLV